MAFTLVLPDGQEISSGPTPHVTAERDVAGLRQSQAEYAQRRREEHARALEAVATPETLAKVAVGAGRPTVAQLLRAAGVAPSAEAMRAGAEALAADAMAETAELRPLQRDPLVFLLGRGSLRGEQVRAGQEICRVYLAISAGVTGRQVASYAECSAKGPAMEDWPAGLRTAYREHYAPWSAWAGTKPVRRKSRHTLHDLALLVAADGWGHRQVADDWGVHHATVVAGLQRCLWWYARNAGWVTEAGGSVAA